jgi:hypothetical protein
MQSSMNGKKYHNQNAQKKHRRLRQENPRSTNVGEEDEPQSRKVHNNGPPSGEHQQQKVDTISWRWEWRAPPSKGTTRGGR